MKTRTKLLIIGTMVGIAVAGVLIAKHLIKTDKEKHSVQIIGGADGPTSVFWAGKVPADKKQAEYTTISMEEPQSIGSL